MTNHFGRIVLLVKDYDQAFDFYSQALGCIKLYDQTLANGQRYLHIGFQKGDKAGIWLLKAEGAEEEAHVGRQTLGQPAMVIYTSSLREAYENLKAKSVRIKVEPVFDASYSFLHFLDLYGNEVILVELSK